jgi:amidohydrolase
VVVVEYRFDKYNGRATANMKPEDFECGEFVEWRRDLHAHPELLYDVQRTASFVATKLNEFGCDEIATEIGRTGVVGLIHGRRRTSGKVIGLRADMDALPIEEATGAPWASQSPGKMHACGHDGHTAMLLGAAQLLARTRQFDGATAVVFQPAEEGGGGGKAMVDDGLMSRFGINEIYAMHTEPGLPVGQFATTAGPAPRPTAFAFTLKARGRTGRRRTSVSTRSSRAPISFSRFSRSFPGTCIP